MERVHVALTVTVGKAVMAYYTICPLNFRSAYSTSNTKRINGLLLRVGGHWLPGNFSPGVKRSGGEGNYLMAKMNLDCKLHCFSIVC
jgi:hypothetical protein